MHIAAVDDKVLFRDYLGRKDTLSPHQRVVLRASDAVELAELPYSAQLGRCDVILLDLRICPLDTADPAEAAKSPSPVTTQGVAAVELLVDVGR